MGPVSYTHLDVYKRQHHTWQGVLQTETGSHPFMNELELLDAISNQMYLEDMEGFSWEKLPWEEKAKV